jgi:hypothetical protein
MSQNVVSKRARRAAVWPAVKHSRPWMDGWLEAAATSQSVEQANTAVNINMFDYHCGRMEDPGFDAAALIFDQILDQLVLFSVRDAAIRGDVKAQLLYYNKARLPAFVPGFSSWRAAARRDEDAGEPQPIDPPFA